MVVAVMAVVMMMIPPRRDDLLVVVVLGPCRLSEAHLGMGRYREAAMIEVHFEFEAEGVK